MTIYLPDDIAAEVRRAARTARTSVSAYMAELATRAVRPQVWPQSFLEAYGGCTELQVPDDALPDEPEAL